ncbi:hypothetical protein BU25DRAFT_413578 [Macroventuria anomochaeta]|uniref:Uncharacterized protein n=1 Tax=Macroventuria anomochaeta TaxID=301207 RepID=A0ACB6RRF9_9PLEO|nr:uncharacterized protein BU25DRAFT_413578 [Macroventuria anomochaeta]KAF2624328.1 hypothetical protein BU25DRAFT_413578 [Macroventuria anomochaeta]
MTTSRLRSHTHKPSVRRYERAQVILNDTHSEPSRGLSRLSSINGLITFTAILKPHSQTPSLNNRRAIPLPGRNQGAHQTTRSILHPHRQRPRPSQPITVHTHHHTVHTTIHRQTINQHTRQRNSTHPLNSPHQPQTPTRDLSPNYFAVAETQGSE